MIPTENPDKVTGLTLLLETNLFMVPMFLDATFGMCPFLVSLHTCLGIHAYFYHDFMAFPPGHVQFGWSNLFSYSVSAESSDPIHLAKHTMEFASSHRDLMTGEPGFL